MIVPPLCQCVDLWHCMRLFSSSVHLCIHYPHKTSTPTLKLRNLAICCMWIAAGQFFFLDTWVYVHLSQYTFTFLEFKTSIKKRKNHPAQQTCQRLRTTLRGARTSSLSLPLEPKLLSFLYTMKALLVSIIFDSQEWFYPPLQRCLKREFVEEVPPHPRDSSIANFTTKHVYPAFLTLRFWVSRAGPC